MLAADFSHPVGLNLVEILLIHWCLLQDRRDTAVCVTVLKLVSIFITLKPNLPLIGLNVRRAGIYYSSLAFIVLEWHVRPRLANSIGYWLAFYCSSLAPVLRMLQYWYSYIAIYYPQMQYNVTHCKFIWQKLEILRQSPINHQSLTYIV